MNRRGFASPVIFYVFFCQNIFFRYICRLKSNHHCSMCFIVNTCGTYCYKPNSIRGELDVFSFSPYTTQLKDNAIVFLTD